MKIFKNRFYFGRNYECTNVVAVVAPQAPLCDFNGKRITDDRWVEAPDLDLSKYEKLWSNGDAQFYGYA